MSTAADLCCPRCFTRLKFLSYLDAYSCPDLCCQYTANVEQIKNNWSAFSKQQTPLDQLLTDAEIAALYDTPPGRSSKDKFDLSCKCDVIKLLWEGHQEGCPELTKNKGE